MRVYYYEKCKDLLILDGIWPALQSIAEREPGFRAYFQRDWLGGPNILVGLRAYDKSQAAMYIGGYLARHPSSASIVKDQYLKHAKSLALWEGRVEDSAACLRPNNYVEGDASEPNSLFLRHEHLKDAVREFLSRSAELVVDWLSLIRHESWQRNVLALHLMIAVVWVADRKRLRPHLSFSSHASGFLRAADPGGCLENHFSNRYAGPSGDAVRHLLKEAVNSLTNGANPLPRMDEFLTLVRNTLRDLFEGLRDRRYQVAEAAELARSSAQAHTNARTIELLDQSPALRAWQITISLVYQTLNQLGMQAYQRFLACYLISRAAEDVYGEPAAQVARELHASGDHNAMFSYFTELMQSGGD